MAGTSLLALIDDIATTLDDVAIMTKVAAKKTAGVLGDDLALNAQQVSGVSTDRELPVVWAVAKGSVVNKVILIPVALLISQFVPVLITPMLMLGGLFLCFEGFEKVFEKLFQKNAVDLKSVDKSVDDDKNEPVLDIHEFEISKIKGAVRTDFILSSEIMVITLGTVATASLSQRILVLTTIGLGMTFGVYGLVAAIVKIDDFGLWLMRKRGFVVKIGQSIVKMAPWLMKFFGIVGTAAMFLVGGGIITHGVPFLHHMNEGMGTLLSMAFDLFVGCAAGGLVFIFILLIKKIRKK